MAHMPPLYRPRMRQSSLPHTTQQIGLLPRNRFQSAFKMDKIQELHIVKQQLNELKTQHVQLRTRYRVLEKDLLQRYADIEDLQSEFQKAITHGRAGPHVSQSLLQNALVQALKKQVRQVKGEKAQLQNAIEMIQREVTKDQSNELAVQLDAYENECIRLRGVLEQSLIQQSKQQHHKLEPFQGISDKERQQIQSAFDSKEQEIFQEKQRSEQIFLQYEQVFKQNQQLQNLLEVKHTKLTRLQSQQSLFKQRSSSLIQKNTQIEEFKDNIKDLTIKNEHLVREKLRQSDTQCRLQDLNSMIIARDKKIKELQSTIMFNQNTDQSSTVRPLKSSQRLKSASVSKNEPKISYLHNNDFSKTFYNKGANKKSVLKKQQNELEPTVILQTMMNEQVFPEDFANVILGNQAHFVEFIAQVQRVQSQSTKDQERRNISQGARKKIKVVQSIQKPNGPQEDNLQPKNDAVDMLITNNSFTENRETKQFLQKQIEPKTTQKQTEFQQISPHKDKFTEQDIEDSHEESYHETIQSDSYKQSLKINKDKDGKKIKKSVSLPLSQKNQILPQNSQSSHYVVVQDQQEFCPDQDSNVRMSSGKLVNGLSQLQSSDKNLESAVKPKSNSSKQQSSASAFKCNSSMKVSFSVEEQSDQLKLKDKQSVMRRANQNFHQANTLDWKLEEDEEQRGHDFQNKKINEDLFDTQIIQTNQNVQNEDSQQNLAGAYESPQKNSILDNSPSKSELAENYVNELLQNAKDKFNQKGAPTETLSEAVMLDLTNKVISRIANALLASHWTCQQVFADSTEHNGSKVIKAESFLAKVYEIGITDLSNRDVSSVVKILGTQDSEDAILYSELEQLIDNFGVVYNSPEKQKQNESKVDETINMTKMSIDSSVFYNNIGVNQVEETINLTPIQEISLTAEINKENVEEEKTQNKDRVETQKQPDQSLELQKKPSIQLKEKPKSNAKRLKIDQILEKSQKSDPCVQNKKSILDFYSFVATTPIKSDLLFKDKVSNEKVCIQIMKKENNIAKNTFQIEHENVQKAIKQYKENNQVYMVLEDIPSQSLLQELDGMDEIKAQSLVKQMLEAIQYLHSQGVIHQELRPKNIMVGDGKVKIKGLWFSQRGKMAEFMKQIRFGAWYDAPEILEGGSWSQQANMWSIGAILFVMLSGQAPYKHGTNDYILEQIKDKSNKPFNLNAFQNVSPEVKSLISQLMHVDPLKRLTTQQSLNHPWFKIKPKEFTEQQIIENNKNVKSLNAQHKLSDVAGIYTKNYIETQNSWMYEQFKQLDSSGDQSIQIEEWIEYLQLLKPLIPKDRIELETRQAFNKIDIDGDGELDFYEWSTHILESVMQENEKNLKEAFEMFERDAEQNMQVGLISEVLSNIFQTEYYIWKIMIRDTTDNNKIDGQIHYGKFAEKLSHTAQGYLARHHPEVLQYEKTRESGKIEVQEDQIQTDTLQSLITKLLQAKEFDIKKLLGLYMAKSTTIRLRSKDKNMEAPMILESDFLTISQQVIPEFAMNTSVSQFLKECLQLSPKTPEKFSVHYLQHLFEAVAQKVKDMQKIKEFYDETDKNGTANATVMRFD